jgi:hypothetical protein
VEWCESLPNNVLRDTITLCGHTFIPVNWSRKEPSIKGFIIWYRSENNPKSDPKSGFFVSPYGIVQSVFNEHEKMIPINDTIFNHPERVLNHRDMEVKLNVLYDLARTVPYSEFEKILKATASRNPVTVETDGELICNIGLTTQQGINE